MLQLYQSNVVVEVHQVGVVVFGVNVDGGSGHKRVWQVFNRAKSHVDLPISSTAANEWCSPSWAEITRGGCSPARCLSKPCRRRWWAHELQSEPSGRLWPYLLLSDRWCLKAPAMGCCWAQPRCLRWFSDGQRGDSGTGHRLSRTQTLMIHRKT